MDGDLDYSDDVEICEPVDNPHYAEPSHPLRSNIFNGGRGYLVAYPSIGGRVILTPTPVDLQYLDLPRTHDTERSLSSVEEDDLALRMLRLGAHWWPTWSIYARHRESLNNGTVYDFHFPPDVVGGYPSSGGAWVAKYTPERIQRFNERNFSLPMRPFEWDRVMRQVLTMDEKCAALKDFGARFYEDVRECEDIPKSLEEGRQQFQRYERHLEKMDDVEYQRRWYVAFHIGGREIEVEDGFDGSNEKAGNCQGCVVS
ncbi:hypothetical protein CkaCkLH20_00664 [Colletotrichum karsti]|uniref:Uncharacterized protein n=1 Tax=Colletotrichum karsti TaxID=1095194 RepID=A0A9P6LPT8_9PEZI|nr:uncharacterized protein CkaCkLH20_00664 [Colletotrichum karsti]KAF9881518.1 hypothetical protein CkaCkLH20_00664 [Colletotrichum karsti]